MTIQNQRITRLSSAQKFVYDLMLENGEEVDVSIKSLYEALGRDGYEEDNHRMYQQRLGAVISTLNKVLKQADVKYRVVPGRVKRTYRLTLV